MTAGTSAPAGAGRRRGGPLTLVVLLTILLGACAGAPTPAAVAPPAHLRLAPCGGESRFTRAEGAAWVVVDARIAVDTDVRVAADGEEPARLCAADGTVLKLAPGTTVELRPAEEDSRLEISLSDGRLLLMAYAPTYRFVVPQGLVQVSRVPARIRVDLDAGTTQVRVEEGRMTFRAGAETTELEPCWEMISAPGVDAVIGNYCAPERDPAPVSATRPPGEVMPILGPLATATPTPALELQRTGSPTPTATATTTPTPSATASPTPSATPTSTPTATPIVSIPTGTPTPTNTPTPLPTDTPPPPATDPPPPPPTDPPPPAPPPTDTPEPEPTPDPTPIP